MIVIVATLIKEALNDDKEDDHIKANDTEVWSTLIDETTFSDTDLSQRAELGSHSLP